MTRKDKIMNEHIIGTTKVAQTSKKIMELEKTGMVWSRDEEGKRARSEKSDDEKDTWIKEERKTEDTMEGWVQNRHADCRTESGRGRRRGVPESEDQQP